MFTLFNNVLRHKMTLFNIEYSHKDTLFKRILQIILRFYSFSFLPYSPSVIYSNSVAKVPTGGSLCKVGALLCLKISTPYGVVFGGQNLAQTSTGTYFLSIIVLYPSLYKPLWFAQKIHKIYYIHTFLVHVGWLQTIDNYNSAKAIAKFAQRG